MFDNLKWRLVARKGYSCHVQGNQMIDKGDVAGAKEKHDEALKLYTQAYEAGYRSDVQVMLAYAVLLMRYGRCQEAKDLLLMCEKQPGLDNKTRKQLRVNYAVCQWKLGELDKAIENMEIAASNGATSMIYTSLGYFYIEKGRETGDFSKAVEYNNEAMEYDDEDAGILDNMGQLNYFMGDHDKAYEYFAKAYNAKSNQAATLYYIAAINLERGNLEKAQAFAERCVEGNFSALATITKPQAEALLEEIRKAKG
ncbi:MAG: hypothetical protein II912_10980 [Clostridia bacterium]|nr:hypothetical protein [Clostridia bacterium]MBR5379730.1 hypothetical protein [Clostridia bacterium]MBR5751710.1 hypothetical protein [Clostridia bacterium]